MPINLRFTPADWECIERDWMAWWAGELDRPMVVITGQEVPPGKRLPEAPGFVSILPFEEPPDAVIDRYQAHLEARTFYGDAFPYWWVNFGPGIVAGFLGARVNPEWDTTWFEPEHLGDIRDLHLRYDPDNIWWQRVQALTRCAAERWAGQVTVSFTDLGGNLDILASLRTTQQLLLDLYDAPEEARSNGPKPLDAATWYGRLGNRLVPLECVVQDVDRRESAAVRVARLGEQLLRPIRVKRDLRLSRVAPGIGRC